MPLMLSTMAALAPSCLRCSAAAALSCLCCPAAAALFNVRCSAAAALSWLHCSAAAALLQQQQQQQQQLHVQQQLAWLQTKLSNGLAAQLCVWTVWLQVQPGTLKLVTAAAGQLCCWGRECWQHWQSLSQSQSHWPQQQDHVPCQASSQFSSCRCQDHLEMQDSSIWRCKTTASLKIST